MTLAILFLLIGFVILIKGADFLVDGAVMIAEKFRIPPLIIGLTIVAFGTSTPELAVNIISSLSPETSDVGLGNIVGSNTVNIGIIVGLSAILTPLVVKKMIIFREIPFMFLSAIVLLILGADKFLAGSTTDFLSAGDGAIMLAFFIIFLYYLSSTIFSQRSESLDQEFSKEYKKPGVSVTRGIIYIVLGLLGVILGGKLVVDNAVTIARTLGLSELLIGLTIIAIGTSLPELATSVVAALKKESDIAVGNIVGSNIFNTFFVLGVNAVIRPVPLSRPSFFDIYVMIAFSALLFIVSATGKKITRPEGVFMVAAYLAYIGYIIYRG